MPDAETTLQGSGDLADLLSAAAAGRTIPTAQFERFCSGGKALERRLGRPVLITHTDPQNRALVTRIWRRKGPLSSDRLRPYSDRFVRAAEAMRRLGVEAPVVRASGRVSGGLRFVTYEPVAGVSLRELGDSFDRLGLAQFVLRLHNLGIYCRGLNLGNVVQLPDGRFGLGDVAQTRFRSRPLSRRQRERNLGILCSHPQDLPVLAGGLWSELVMAYCLAADVSLACAARMRERVRLQVERRQARRALAKDAAARSAAHGTGVDSTVAAQAVLPRS